MCVHLCTEENLRCTHTLEDMQRRLEEEHALQMSLLLAQQEREQQRLCLVSMWNHTVPIYLSTRRVSGTACILLHSFIRKCEEAEECLICFVVDSSCTNVDSFSTPMCEVLICVCMRVSLMCLGV